MTREDYTEIAKHIGLIDTLELKRVVDDIVAMGRPAPTFTGVREDPANAFSPLKKVYYGFKYEGISHKGTTSTVWTPTPLSHLKGLREAYKRNP